VPRSTYSIACSHTAIIQTPLTCPQLLLDQIVRPPPSPLAHSHSTALARQEVWGVLHSGRIIRRLRSVIAYVVYLMAVLHVAVLLQPHTISVLHELIASHVFLATTYVLFLMQVLLSVVPLLRRLQRQLVHRSTERYDLFLSHAWGWDAVGRDNHERVRQVALGLQSHGLKPWLSQCTHSPHCCSRARFSRWRVHCVCGAGLKIWLDEEEMHDDLTNQMSDGIDCSRLVAVFITTSYIRKVQGLGPSGLGAPTH
jgi:hypothetical protein